MNLRAGQVSKLMDISGASLRNYVKWFAQFLSDDATKGSGRYFSASDLSILEEARRLLRAGWKVDEVSEELKLFNPEERPIQLGEDGEVVLAESQRGEVNLMHQLIATYEGRLQDKDVLIQELKEGKARQMEKLDDLRKENEALKTSLEELERLAPQSVGRNYLGRLPNR
ncbi:MAG: MerR family transcriptional regulator [Chloroflexi bacterium]|nr:MAG: MerR family transcriptional regulator [Chloroflexota bacterium]MBL1196964.1 MerR family transcriptional regulator [Chloroflexota bacterium]NOH14260.1 MerR family transcriptional regulator [Chloroflexota bacterium]